MCALIVLSALAVLSCKQDSATGSPNSGSLVNLGLPPSPDSGSGAATGPSATTPFNVVLTWNANHEKAVNTTGGGYLIYQYHASGPGVSATFDQVISVPYVGGAAAPTTTTITGLTLHSPWIYKFQIQGFSALIGRSGSNSLSSLSPPITVTAP
jgi:hypothetical protein